MHMIQLVQQCLAAADLSDDVDLILQNMHHDPGDFTWQLVGIITAHLIKIASHGHYNGVVLR